MSSVPALVRSWQRAGSRQMPLALAPPAGISPASTTEQKQHQENNQYGYHVSPPLLEEAAELIQTAALLFPIRNIIIMDATKAGVCPIVTRCLCIFAHLRIG
jgi:hypothetical protein